MPLAFIPSPSHAIWHAGPVPFRLQALFAVAGVALAIAIAERRYRAAGGRPGAVLDIAVWAVPAGLIPAALGAFLAPARGAPWQQVRTWDEALGYPGAAALGILAAWLACRLPRRRRPPRRLPPRRRPPRPRRSLASPGKPGKRRTPESPINRGKSIKPGKLRNSGKGRKPAKPRKPVAPARPGKPSLLGKLATPGKLAPLAGAVAPAMAFGHAVAALGGWAAQEGYGHPSSLWWAVQISPAHRLPGYENFATFQPMFLYEALWDVATGVAVIWAARRFALNGGSTFALQAAAYAAGGFALFWLGIGHLPLVLGIRAGELGDALVLVGSVTYLARTWHKRTPPLQVSAKVPLERDSPVM
jgi:prolipoprotein diacylglyceryltransferase